MTFDSSCKVTVVQEDTGFLGHHYQDLWVKGVDRSVALWLGLEQGSLA